MSKTDDEIRSAYVALCAEHAREKHPGITAKQAAAIGERTASRVGIWSESMLTNTELAGWLTDAEIGVDRGLVRAVPTRADAQAWLERTWLADFEATSIPASEQINIKRRIDKMTDDDLLASVPADFSAAEQAPTETEILEARTAQPKKLTAAEQEKLDDDWLLRNLGPSYAPHLIDPRKRAELLAKRDANENRSLRADAQRLDGYNQRFGADASDDKLSGAEMVARERAKRAVARAK